MTLARPITRALRTPLGTLGGGNLPWEDGGGGALWTPARLTSLRGWYRADLGVTLVGSDVDAWADQSGNANHLTAAAAGNRPLYSATGGPNSKPCMSFDGVGEWLRKSGFSWGAAVGAHTIVMVAKCTSHVANDIWLDYGTNIRARSGATNVFEGVRAGVVASTGTTSAAGFHAFMYTWSGSSQSVYADGAAEDTDANAGAAVADAAVLSVGGSTTGTLLGAIDVSEVILMRAVATAAEQASLDTYMAREYAL